MSEPRFATVSVGPGELHTATWGDGTPEIVMLHDGLGSISQWRHVPAEIGEATGKTVLAYDRSGHGSSTPTPTGPWPADWLHTEADMLAELLDTLEVKAPVLVGHSDGGSIALLHAVNAASDSRLPQPAGVLAFAAHSWVETVAFDHIATLRATAAPVIAGLTRHHADPEAIFEAWSGAWTSDAFLVWDIRPLLRAITAPVLIAQGAADEYATDAQAIETAAAIGANARCTLIPRRAHLLHHEDPVLFLQLVAAFAADHLGN